MCQGRQACAGFLKGVGEELALLVTRGACAGFLKGVGEELARSAGSEVVVSEAICRNGPGAQPPEKFLTEFYAEQIGYQYRYTEGSKQLITHFDINNILDKLRLKMARILRYFGYLQMKTRVAVWFSVRYLVLDRHVP